MSTVSKLEKVSGPEPHKNKFIGINYTESDGRVGRASTPQS